MKSIIKGWEFDDIKLNDKNRGLNWEYDRIYFDLNVR